MFKLQGPNSNFVYAGINQQYENYKIQSITQHKSNYNKKFYHRMETVITTTIAYCKCGLLIIKYNS